MFHIGFVEDSTKEMKVGCLEVTAIHSTRDMSVANSTRVTGFYPYREIKEMTGKKGISLMSGFAPWRVISVSEEEVTLSWCKKTYTVRLGDTISTDEYAIDNPYLSWEGISLKIRYERVPVLDTFISEFNSIVNRHHSRPSTVGKTAEEKEKCSKLLYELIVAGEDCLLPIYAWISASRNWNTMIITDHKCFSKTLGSLNIDDIQYINTWLHNMAHVFTRNESGLIFDSVPGLKELLQTASEKGYEKAEEILNGKIQYRRLSERENPDCKELLLYMEIAENEDDEVPCIYRYVTRENLAVGHKITMGEYEDVEIIEVAQESVRIAWRGRELKVKNDDFIHNLDYNTNEVTSMDYALGYVPEKYLSCKLTKVNLWEEAERLIAKSRFTSLHSPEEIAHYTDMAKFLIRVLITRGDSELEETYNEL